MSITIECPRCHRPRDFSHLPQVVSDWENILALLAGSECMVCIQQEILKSLKVGSICLYMGPEDGEE